MDPIQATADEALNAKLSTVLKGYHVDPFLHHFSTDDSNRLTSSSGMQPIIRRGTHARICCMDTVIAAAIHHIAELKKSQVLKYGDKDDNNVDECDFQVLVLGAGKGM